MATPTEPSLADRFLDAQVAFHLDRLSGEQLVPTVTAVAEQLLDAVDEHTLAELVDADLVAEVVVRALATVPGSPAVREIVEMAVDVAYDGPDEPFAIGEVVARERVEVLLDRLLALTPALERALDRIAESPLVGTVATRFMGRVVGEVLQANQAVAGKVPGLGSLMAFGTSAASKVMGAADKQFEALLGASVGGTVGKSSAFAVRRLNGIVVETLRDPTTRDALLQVWDQLARERVTGLQEYATREEIGGVVVAGHELVADAAATAPVAREAKRVVAVFFERFGDRTPAALLEDLAVSRDDLLADLARLAPPIADALRSSGALERIVRAQLEPFYASPEVAALLGG